MSATVPFTLWVSVFPAEDVPGEWVAHDVKHDLVTQGRDVPHALDMIAEAAAMCLDDDVRGGRNPRERKTPTKEFYAHMAVVARGERHDPDTIAERETRHLAFTLTLALVPGPVEETHAVPLHEWSCLSVYRASAADLATEVA